MSRLERLVQRRIDSSILAKASMANEVYQRIKDSEAVRYAIGAMQPIDSEYTKNTVAQGDRVKSQLDQRLDQRCDFVYQGSTATDTHIKARSDIDLLLVYRGWVWLEPPQVPRNPYAGVPANDIRKLRIDAVSAMRSAFPEANVDNTGTKAIRMYGASLTRQIDVVPASWYDTNEYTRTGDKVFRGVRVFDEHASEFVVNTPFLHKHRIEARDKQTLGGLRKAARLMKTLMYDSDGRVQMSSYDIVGIAYNIPILDITVQAPRELTILEACLAYCERLTNDSSLRGGILVPDSHRPVFGPGLGATATQLSALTKELNDLKLEVLRDNAKSITRLVEGTAEYAIAIV